MVCIYVYISARDVAYGSRTHTHTVCVHCINSGAHGEKVVSILRDSLAFIINGGGMEKEGGGEEVVLV